MKSRFFIALCLFFGLVSSGMTEPGIYQLSHDETEDPGLRLGGMFDPKRPMKAPTMLVQEKFISEVLGHPGGDDGSSSKTLDSFVLEEMVTWDEKATQELHSFKSNAQYAMSAFQAKAAFEGAFAQTSSSSSSSKSVFIVIHAKKTLPKVYLNPTPEKYEPEIAKSISKILKYKDLNEWSDFLNAYGTEVVTAQQNGAQVAVVLKFGGLSIDTYNERLISGSARYSNAAMNVSAGVSMEDIYSESIRNKSTSVSVKGRGLLDGNLVSLQESCEALLISESTNLDKAVELIVKKIHAYVEGALSSSNGVALQYQTMSVQEALRALGLPDITRMPPDWKSTMAVILEKNSAISLFRGQRKYAERRYGNFFELLQEYQHDLKTLGIASLAYDYENDNSPSEGGPESGNIPERRTFGEYLARSKEKTGNPTFFANFQEEPESVERGVIELIRYYERDNHFSILPTGELVESSSISDNPDSPSPDLPPYGWAEYKSLGAWSAHEFLGGEARKISGSPFDYYKSLTFQVDLPEFAFRKDPPDFLVLRMDRFDGRDNNDSRIEDVFEGGATIPNSLRSWEDNDISSNYDFVLSEIRHDPEDASKTNGKTLSLIRDYFLEPWRIVIVKPENGWASRYEIQIRSQYTKESALLNGSRVRLSFLMY